MVDTAPRSVRGGCGGLLRGSTLRRLLLPIVTLAMTLAAAPARALAPGVEDVRFARLSNAQGLEQPSVRAILQDRTGFVWIGTRDGLFRYDGRNLRVFRRVANSDHDLPDDSVNALAEDRQSGLIYVGTRFGGLARFDPQTERFSQVDLSAAPSSSALAGEIAALHVDIGGRLWIARADGILLTKTRSSEHADLVVGWDAAFMGAVHDFLEPAAGQVEAAADHGYFSLSAMSGAMRIAITPEQRGGYTALASTAKGRLLGSASGLIEIDAEHRVVRRLDSRSGGGMALPDDAIRFLLRDHQDRLWIGTNNGLARLDPGATRLRIWRHGSDPAGLSSDRLATAMLDRDGVLWFGTSGDGIALHDPAQESFIRVAGDPDGLPATPVAAVEPEADGTWWMGLLDGGGLVHFDAERGLLARYRHLPEHADSLQHDRVRDLLRARDGALWVATQGGVDRMATEGRFEHFVNDPRRDDTLPAGRIDSLFEDRDGTLWAGAADATLSAIAKDSHAVRRHAMWGEDTSHDEYQINSIAQAPDNAIWVAMAYGGVSRLDPVSGKVLRFRHQPGRDDSLPFDEVDMVLFDSRGWLWVATHGGGLGLAKNATDPGHLSFTVVDRRHGMASDVLTALVEDRQGALWVSSVSGLSRVDPGTLAVVNFAAAEGALNAGYFVSAVATDTAGNLLFGGPGGMTVVRTSDSWRPRDAPAPIVTEIRVLNRPLPLSWQDPTSTLKVSPPFATGIGLSWQEGSIALAFSSLTFSGAERIRYAYRIEGLGEDWLETPPGFGYAAVNGLAPGRYRLHLRAASPQGQWQESPRVLAIDVAPPWWRSSGFYAVIAAALALLLLRQVLAARERRRTIVEEAIAGRILEERLRLALEASNGELWELSLPDGTYIRESPKPGFVQRDRGGRGVTTISQYNVDVHPDDLDNYKEEMRRHLRGETPLYDVTFRVRNLDGEYRWVRGRGRVVWRDEDQRARRVVGTTVDITELMQREAELRRLNTQLEQRVGERTRALQDLNDDLSKALANLRLTQEQLVESEKMASLGGLVAGVAHEINTPIGIGVTAASLLVDEARQLKKRRAAGKSDPEDVDAFAELATESSELILGSLERADKLVKSFKQVAVEQSSEERRHILLDRHVDEIATSLRPLLRKAGRTLEVMCPPDIAIDSYPGALFQVLTNLVMNSHVHGYEGVDGGTIHLVCEDYGDSVQVIVGDQGVGMEEAVRKRVFEPFFTTKRGRGGTGLGLNIVYNLVTGLLGGSIRCESAKGVGTRFVVRVPKQAPIARA